MNTPLPDDGRSVPSLATTRTPPENKRIIGLDTVRAIAISSVVLCHLLLWAFPNTPRLLPIAYALGVSGVELFFVLSGFLIGGILFRQIRKTGTFTLGDLLPFWVRRWWRTLPNYLLFLGINFLVLLSSHAVVSFDHWRYWFFWQNLVPTYPSNEGFFGESWSLAIEEWMYLLLPITIAVTLLERRWRRNVSAAILVSVLFLILYPTGARLLTTNGLLWDLQIRKIVIYRLDAIGYGALFAYVATFHSELFKKITTRPLFLFGIVLSLVANALILLLIRATDARFSGLHGILMNTGEFLLMDVAFGFIVAYASTVRTLPLALSKLSYRVSLYSYAMYLCHRLLFLFLTDSLRTWAPVSSPLFYGIILLFPGILFVVSAGIYHFFEYPMTNLREKWPLTQTMHG